MLAFFGLGPTELIIIGGIGLLIAVVVVAAVSAGRGRGSSGRQPDPSQLTTCAACGRTISLAATACPNCGHPNQPQPPVRG